MLPLIVFTCLTVKDILTTSRNSVKLFGSELSQVDFLRTVSDEDIKSIEEQLGYIPTNLVSVSARRSTGTPLALKTYPLNGGASRRKAKALGELTPFPTLYWFACPIVGKAVADLERQGYVGIFEERLNNDAEALDDFIKSHKGYANERWHSLVPQHQNYIESKGERMTAMVRSSGIAGTDFEPFAPSTIPGYEPDKPSIKCLHAHYAHYRSQIENPECDYNLNIVGEWIHAELLNQNVDLKL